MYYVIVCVHMSVHMLENLSIVVLTRVQDAIQIAILFCLVNHWRNLGVHYFYTNQIRFWCCDRYADYTFTTPLYFGAVANSQDNGRTEEANLNPKRIQSATHCRLSLNFSTASIPSTKTTSLH